MQVRTLFTSFLDFAVELTALTEMGFIFQASERDNEFVTHYRTKLGTRRADTSYRRRPLMTRCVTDIHAAAVRSLRGSTVANKSEKTIRDY